MLRFLAWLAIVLAAGAAPAADANGVFSFDEQTPVPPAVLAVQDCDATERTPAHRRPFAGGFVFAVKCASNNENFVETLIFAPSEDGAGAALLEFPLPPHRGGGTQATIANIRWFPGTNEIAEIFVDREVEERVDPNVCRTEGRWKLEGTEPKPKLVFWRETKDCEGRKGWVTVVGGR